MTYSLTYSEMLCHLIFRYAPVLVAVTLGAAVPVSQAAESGAPDAELSYAPDEPYPRYEIMANGSIRRYPEERSGIYQMVAPPESLPLPPLQIYTLPAAASSSALQIYPPAGVQQQSANPAAPLAISPAPSVPEEKLAAPLQINPPR